MLKKKKKNYTHIRTHTKKTTFKLGYERAAAKNEK